MQKVILNKMEPEIEKRKETAIKTAKAAGKILINNFTKPVQVRAKADRNFVTDIDLQAEKAIARLISRYYPHDNILSEESHFALKKGAFTWIIDPIDGTHNYIHRIPIFGTSIAVAFQGEVILGIIYLPLTKKLYLACKGQGAYLNGKRIFVSKRKVREATLIYDSSIRIAPKPMLKVLGVLSENVFNLRMFGSTVQSLAYIAQGNAEAEVEFNDRVWDFAAGLLLVEEANGKVTDFYGRKWNIKTKGYVASNGVIHRQILQLMGKR